MSLTSADIEAVLSDGLYFSKGDHEFAGRLEQGSDTFVVHEMSGSRRHRVPLESILDTAHADERGSDLEDITALKRILGGFALT